MLSIKQLEKSILYSIKTFLSKKEIAALCLEVRIYADTFVKSKRLKAEKRHISRKLSEIIKDKDISAHTELKEAIEKNDITIAFLKECINKNN